MSKNNEGMGFVLGILVGAIVGASAAIVLTPQSGEETRGMIRNQAADLKEKMAELTADYKAKMADLAEEYKATASQYREKMADFACDMQHNTNTLIERGKDYYAGMNAPKAQSPVSDAAAQAFGQEV